MTAHGPEPSRASGQANLLESVFAAVRIRPKKQELEDSCQKEERAFRTYVHCGERTLFSSPARARPTAAGPGNTPRRDTEPGVVTEITYVPGLYRRVGYRETSLAQSGATVMDGLGVCSMNLGKSSPRHPMAGRLQLAWTSPARGQFGPYASVATAEADRSFSRNAYTDLPSYSVSVPSRIDSDSRSRAGIGSSAPSSVLNPTSWSV